MAGAFDTRDPGVLFATGAELFIAVPCIAGADRPSAVLKMLNPSLPGRQKCYPLPTGTTTFTLAMLAWGVLQSVNSGAPSTILMPTLATLGWTYDPYNELAIPLQRAAVGILAFNVATGVTISDPNNLDPVNLGIFHPVVWAVLDGTGSGGGSWHYE